MQTTTVSKSPKLLNQIRNKLHVKRYLMRTEDQ